MYTEIDHDRRTVLVTGSKFMVDPRCPFDVQVKYLNDKRCGGRLVRVTGKDGNLCGCLSCGRIIAFTSFGRMGEQWTDRYHAGVDNVHRRARAFYDRLELGGMK